VLVNTQPNAIDRHGRHGLRGGMEYPPSANHYWRHVGPRTLISREGRTFRRRVCAILAAARVVPMDGPLAVAIDVYPPDRRRRDIDNLQKPLLDALEKGQAYHDDSQIKNLHTRMFEPVRGGKVIVRITPLP